LAHPQALLRSNTVELAFNGEQNVDGLANLAVIGARLNRIEELYLPWAQHAGL
jgi:hypothetical protein